MNRKEGRSVTNASVRRRQQRAHKSRALSPIALTISLLVILTSLFGLVAPPAAAMIVKGVSAPAGPMCVPCPGGTRCVPNCVYFATSVTTNSTNVTIKWELPGSDAYVSLVWGNTTNYGFWAIKNVHYNNGIWFYVPLDYLQPGTPYYYKFTGNASGENMGTYTGLWTTASEQNYYNSWGINIRGTVVDKNNTKAPSNLYVQVICTAGDDSYYGTTNGNGAFVISVADELGRPGCTADNGYYAVQVVNTPEKFYGGGSSTQWNGRWNETIVVWAPQFVNFYLDLAALSSPSKPVVDEMEFTHSAHAQLTACSSQVSNEEFQSTSTASGSLFGVSFNVQSTSVKCTQFGTNGCISNQGEPGLEVWGEEETSGMMVFNAIVGRSVSIPWEQYYGGLQNGGNAGSGNATDAPIQDWMTEPSIASQVCTIDGIVWLNWPIPGDSGVESYGMIAAGGVSSISGETWGLSVPLYLDGTQVGTFGYSNGFTVSTSESSQFSVNFIIPDSSVTQYYTVACSGGNSGSGTGIVLHVWQDST